MTSKRECPCCGDALTAVEIDEDWRVLYRAKCQSCELEGPFCMTPEAAIYTIARPNHLCKQITKTIKDAIKAADGGDQ